MHRTWIPLLALLTACAPATEGGEDAGGPTASFEVTGAISASGASSSFTAAAVDEVLESFTRRKLTLTLTHATGGTLTMIVSDSNGAPSTGEYVAFNSQQVIVESSWKIGAVTYVNIGDAATDASTATFTALDWSPGGALSGTFALTLVDPGDSTRVVNLSGSLDGALTSGP